MMKAKLRSRQSGFTIVEMLIATAVFSVVLLLVTFGILQITRVYYKGVTETNTQNTARSVIDSISQAIQFSGVTNIQPTNTLPGGGKTPGVSYGFCIGNERFSYLLGHQVVDAKTSGSQAFHALVQDTTASCAGPVGSVGNLRDTQSFAGTRELLSKRMRLAKLSVEPVTGATNLWRITIKVVHGDDDLLLPDGAPTGPDVLCKTAVQGTQFCSISELSTVVVKRVQ